MVAQVLAAALTDVPAGAWLADDGTERQALYERCVPVLVEHALQHGAVYIAGQEAVAVWYPMMMPALDDAGVRARLAAAAGSHIYRLLDILEPTAPHRCEVPHHHLVCLGVAPRYRRQRLGSALLADAGRRLDADRIAAYAEAADEPGRALYARHGFVTAKPIGLPDNGPLLWPMWRDPA